MVTHQLIQTRAGLKTPLNCNLNWANWTSWLIPHGSLKTITWRNMLKCFVLFMTKIATPNSITALIKSLWLLHYRVHSLWGRAKQGHQRRETSILTNSIPGDLWIFWSHKIKAKWGTVRKSLHNPKLRGGAWDDTGERCKKRSIGILCALDCKWGISILYGELDIYSAQSSSSSMCAQIPVVYRRQQACTALYSLGYF